MYSYNDCDIFVLFIKKLQCNILQHKSKAYATEIHITLLKEYI